MACVHGGGGRRAGARRTLLHACAPRMRPCMQAHVGHPCGSACMHAGRGPCMVVSWLRIVMVVARVMAACAILCAAWACTTVRRILARGRAAELLVWRRSAPAPALPHCHRPAGLLSPLRLRHALPVQLAPWRVPRALRRRLGAGPVPGQEFLRHRHSHQRRPLAGGCGCGALGRAACLPAAGCQPASSGNHMQPHAMGKATCVQLHCNCMRCCKRLESTTCSGGACSCLRACV